MSEQSMTPDLSGEGLRSVFNDEPYLLNQWHAGHLARVIATHPDGAE
jgi:predicted nicotinamide N-methyase